MIDKINQMIDILMRRVQSRVMSSAKSLELKDKIYRAAKELFAAVGYYGASIRDIAAQAGANSSLISYHFGSKEGLLLHIVGEAFGEHYEEIFEILDEPVQSLEEFRIRLEMFMDIYLKRGVEDWELMKIIFSELPLVVQKGDDSFNRRARQSLERLGEFIASGVSKKILRSEIEPDVMADNLFALLNDQILSWKVKVMLQGPDFSKKEVRRSWIRSTLDLYLFGGVAS
jgi:AcrR family transcriptional regulator